MFGLVPVWQWEMYKVNNKNEIIIIALKCICKVAVCR